MLPPAATVVGYEVDAVTALAERIIADHSDRLPLLDGVVVLLPTMDAAPRLRRTLLEVAASHGCGGLLGPRIHAFGHWLSGHPLTMPVLDTRAAELVLGGALRRYRQLFGNGNLWAIAESLLALFDELTRHRVRLPNTLDTFTDQLARAYGTGPIPLSGLSQEARVVHTLWHAWNADLRARGRIDSAGADIMRLAAALQAGGDSHLYLAGFAEFSPVERQWLERLQATGYGVTLLLQTGTGDTTSTTPLGRFLDTVYTTDGATLRERARAFAGQHPDPVTGRLTLLAADDAEHEARAVELQVRMWLLEGRHDLAVVTEDRRLARRIRALLERAGVMVRDRGGWALSTTSAAAALERWLECVEEDFPHVAMLDLLKSPFLDDGGDREQQLATVYRLEQDIVRHENVGRGLSAYGQRLRSRQRRLPTQLASNLDAVATLLGRLGEAANLLTPLLRGRHSPEILLARLTDSLAHLGMDTGLQADAAGARVWAELERMRRAAREEPDPLDWGEFRTWLGQALESSHFRPPVDGGRVLLLDLEQSALGRFDAVVLAGAEREHLPGSVPASPFFNDAVRRELGLPDRETWRRTKFHRFRRLLEAAPRVLVTCRREQDGEPILPSPWVEALDAFHRLGYGGDLAATDLAEFARRPESEVADRAPPLPRPERQPTPAAQPALLPEAVSASAYQQLMECPYQFYAARLLRLAAPDAIREALEKSDYGERVHRCLEAFHAGIDGLPGPFGQPLTEASRTAAIALLEEIARKVFDRDLEDNFLHRGWLFRWLEILPAYVDWAIARARHWRFTAAEVEGRVTTADARIEGRLDRIDRSEEGLAVVDYKTGRVPSYEAVLAGEAVQLPLYALVAAHVSGDPVARAEYLLLDKGRAESKAALEGSELAELSRAVNERLTHLLGRLQAGEPLPAWGDGAACGYCAFDGLCRREAWEGLATDEKEKGR